MEMLNVCYVKVRAMLNQGKTEMLNLGYGNVRARLRQNALSPAPARVNSRSRIGQGSHIWELKAGSWELKLE